MSDPVPAAVLVSDIHNSDRPPAARAEEPDWMRTQQGYWQQVSKLCFAHDVPLIIAGDVFDDGWRTHRCSPELINMVLRNIPRAYGIPGQHDLKNHRLEDLKKTAFWTLVESGKLTYLEPEKPVEVAGRIPMRLWGFPWGVPVTPLNDPHDMMLEVAVIHAMIYTKATSYPGAPEDGYFKNWKERLRGYDVALFGDNHSPFEKRLGDCLVWNNGGFMRRRSDEIDHKPRVGLLYSDGTVKPHYLNVSKDKITKTDDDAPEADVPEVLHEFVKELRELTDRALDFEAALLRWMEKEGTSPQVRELVLKALG